YAAKPLSECRRECLPTLVKPCETAGRGASETHFSDSGRRFLSALGLKPPPAEALSRFRHLHYALMPCANLMKGRSECHQIPRRGDSLRRALKNFCEHYHGERNHQSKSNKLLFPRPGPQKETQGSIRGQEQLGGLLIHREAA